MASITAIHHHLPSQRLSLDELEARALLRSGREALRDFGFEGVHVADEESRYDLARAAARGLLAEFSIDARSVDVLIYATALPGARPRASRDPITLFKYEATSLQNELGLDRATAISIAEGGCVSLFSAIRTARALLASEPDLKRLLVVGADRLPPGSRREILFNVISDGACAVLVEREGTNRIVSYSQTTKGFYWNASERRNELLATYFPTAQKVIADALAKAALTAAEIALVLPHNVNSRSWEMLLDIAGIEREKLYRTNIARRGHTIAADPLINLRDAASEGILQRGDHLLLFTFGFGAHWAAMVVQH